MTKMQNFKLQGCFKIINEYNDRICNLASTAINLPIPILNNIKKVLKASHNLLSEFEILTTKNDITDNEIKCFQQKIGCLGCNVAMMEIQVDFYKTTT